MLKFRKVYLELLEYLCKYGREYQEIVVNMTVRFKQKTRKWRGRTSHGWGMKKKHRGGGSQGGRGLGGSHKHKFSFVTSKDLGRFGYNKLLGTGKISRAITVKVGTCSKKAKEKIEKAGGKIEGK